MKRRDQSLLNYTIFILITVALGYFVNNYKHDYPIDIERLEHNLNTVNQKLNVTLNFNIPKTISGENRQSLVKNIDNLFKKQFYLDYDIAQPASNVLVIDVICQEKSKNIEITSGGYNIKYYAGNTCENITEQELKELRRVALTFSLNLLEFSYEERYHDKDIFFNIYFYVTFDPTKETAQQIKDLKKTLADQTLQFSQALSISKDQIRVNLKTIHPDELNKLTVNDVLGKENAHYIKFSAVKSLHNQLTGNFHDRINFRDYYNRQIIIFLNDVEAKISDSEENIGYYLNYENDIFISGLLANPKKIQTIFNRALIELYELSEIYTLTDSLQHTTFDLNLNALTSYFLKREYYSTYQAIYSQINSVIKLRSAEHIIFKLKSTEIIDQWISQTEEILKLNERQPNKLQKIVYKQDDLNKIEEIGILDYFSSEYLMGVYLPVVIPVAYPYILGILGKVKELKKRGKKE